MLTYDLNLCPVLIACQILEPLGPLPSNSHSELEQTRDQSRSSSRASALSSSQSSSSSAAQDVLERASELTHNLYRLAANSSRTPIESSSSSSLGSYDDIDITQIQSLTADLDADAHIPLERVEAASSGDTNVIIERMGDVRSPSPVDRVISRILESEGSSDVVDSSTGLENQPSEGEIRGELSRASVSTASDIPRVCSPF